MSKCMTYDKSKVTESLIVIAVIILFTEITEIRQIHCMDNE